MTYNGKQYTQPFEVWRDVTLPSTDADLVAGTDAAAQRRRRAINEVVDKINRIEIMRDAGRGPAQGARRRTRRSTRRSPASTSGCTTRSCTSCRGPRCTATTSGTSKKYKLYMNLVWLLAADRRSGGGDVAAAWPIGRPTRRCRRLKDFQGQMVTAQADFDKLLREVEAFNKTHAGKLAAITDKLGPSK